VARRKRARVELDGSLLPSPSTPKGDCPTGQPDATPTVAYAQELGYDVAPLEAYVRYECRRRNAGRW
jgi:hypothetical protein